MVLQVLVSRNLLQQQKKSNFFFLIVFCATATYAATSLIRGHQDNWNLLPCGAFIGGWSMHRFGMYTFLKNIKISI